MINNNMSSKATIFKHTLMYEIETGVYRQSNKLPSERNLSLKHNISRSTVRQAMNELEENGIIIRRQPVGAFVTENALKIIASLQNSQTSLSVAFVIQDTAINNHLIESIFATCRQYMDKSIKMFVVFDTFKTPTLDNIDADIVVLYSCINRQRINKIKQQVNSLILLNRIDEEHNYITVDNFSGGTIMMEHLKGNGHQYIGCIGPIGNDNLSDFGQRFSGIERVCQSSGISLAHYSLALNNFADFTSACHWALDHLWHQMPEMTAVIGLYDEVALAIMNSLRFRGKKIPEDISVIGFDNHFYSQYMECPLSTVKYPAESIGVKLATFIENVKDGKSHTMQERIAPLLIDRYSVRNLAE
ncbi:MAG: GntR family transcriptional regulator [Victivallales bacterium]|nr:GntR family transcriptional regulator [Victivallales bacterium]